MIPEPLAAAIAAYTAAEQQLVATTEAALPPGAAIAWVLDRQGRDRVQRGTVEAVTGYSAATLRVRVRSAATGRPWTLRVAQLRALAEEGDHAP